MISVVDCHYLERPAFAGAYLVREGDRGAFVDNGTARSVPRLLEAARASGIGPEAIDYVIITHVHLDHAGGTGALMAACPRARLLAHPRAARHAIDPSKLVASARKVYGDAEFDRLYGAIAGIDASRVREMQDGETLRWGSRELTFLHTRGHANHHFVIHDSATRSVLTGDSFGLAYPALRGLVFPSTSPTDFDPAEAHASVDRIVATGARRAWLTHFGAVDDLAGAAEQMHRRLDAHARALDWAVASPLAGEALAAACRGRLEPEFRAMLAERSLEGSAAAWDLVRLDFDLNAQGIAWVAEKRRKSGA